MKEGKKTTAKRKVSSSQASKRVAPKNQTPRMPEHRDEPPKVKKIDVEEINKDFDDVESDDRRLIVFIAIAILVIVGTVIGLLVGCEKKENDNPEPIKPGTDVVVPEKPDEKGNKDEGVVTREVVRKVRSVYKTKKTKKIKDKKDEEEETVTYNVTFYLGEETETEEVEDGKTPSEYVPIGYSVCRYYKDSELTEEYDMTQAIKQNVNIYMDCDAINYTVDYGDVTTDNVTGYSVTDGDVTLNDPQSELVFNGWYTDVEFTNKVTSLNKDLIVYLTENELVKEDNIIHLYAYLTEEAVEPTEGDVTDDTQDDTQDDTVTTEQKLDENVVDEEDVTDDTTEEETTVEDTTEETTVEDTTEEKVDETETEVIVPETEETTDEVEEETPVVEEVTTEEDEELVADTESEEVTNKTDEVVVNETEEKATVEDTTEEPVDKTETEVVPEKEETPVVENKKEETTETKTEKTHVEETTKTVEEPKTEEVEKVVETEVTPVEEITTE